MKLDNLAIGKSAVIVSVGGTGALRQHFLDMGLIQGVEVTMVKYAPMGDPIEIKIHDYELTLRKEDAQKIEIKEVIKKEELKNENIIFKNKNHPGYGESSYDKINNHQIYHESDLLTFALVGNQNCGKTTLFNFSNNSFFVSAVSFPAKANCSTSFFKVVIKSSVFFVVN